MKRLSSSHPFSLLDMNVCDVYSERCLMKMSGSGEFKVTGPDIKSDKGQWSHVKVESV